MERIYNIEDLPVSFFFFCDHYRDSLKNDKVVEDIAKATNTTPGLIRLVWDACIADNKIFVYSKYDQRLYWFADPTRKSPEPGEVSFVD